MNFYYSEDAAQRQNRWVLTIIGAMAIVICIYGIIVQFIEVSWLNAVTISLLLLSGIYNFTTGIRLFTKMPAGRNFIYVDETAIFVKKEMKKLKVFEWENIHKISIRRSGIHIELTDKSDKVSYDMLPYREVKEFQSALVKLGAKKNVTVILELDENLQTA